MRVVLAAAALMLLLVACGTDAGEDPSERAGGTDQPSAPSEPRGAQKQPADDEPAPPQTSADEPEDEPSPAAGPSAADDPPGSDEPAAEAEPPPPAAASDPGELTATPLLAEGPYYPNVETRPSDSDSDLLLLTGSPAIASGQPLQLDGQLLDTAGDPVAGATIELWQTDVQGIYLHPNDPRVDERDAYFQSYGEALTDDAGAFSFRTIFPGLYEDRPRHLHVKVKLDGAELLTTHIYFAGDPELATDSQTAGLGPELLDAISITPLAGVDEVGFAISTASHIIVVDPDR